MNRDPYFSYVWMLLGSLSFASMGTLAHALAPSFDWRIIALARTSIALFLAILLALAAGKRLVFWRPLTLWIRSIAGTISLFCTFFALTRLPVGDVLTLTNMFPIWVALLSWPLFKEKPGVQVWISVVVSLIGVILIQQPHFAEGNFASLVALASSFSTAVAMLGLHKLHGIDPRAIVVHFSAFSLFSCLVCVLFLGETVPVEKYRDLRLLSLLAGVGLTATVGQIFLTMAFAAGPPSKVSVVGLTQVVFALLFDVFLWHRSVGIATLIGIGLVLTPTALLVIQRGTRFKTEWNRRRIS